MVFLDLDGVCVNLYYNYFKYKGDDPDLWKTLKDGTVNDYYEQNNDEFIKDLIEWGSEFWATAPKYPWTDTLIRAAGDDFCFLSSPSGIPTAAQGKLLWVERHYPKSIRNLILASSENKYLLCRNFSDLLVDDWEPNIEDWETVGGSSIFFNRDRAINDGDYLKDIVEVFRQYHKYNV